MITLMESATFFDSIAVETPREQIFHRLGYKKGRTQISSVQLHEIESFIDEAVTIVCLRGVAVRIPILDRGEGWTRLKTGQSMNSAQLTALLVNSEEILLIGATTGEDIMARIRDDSARNRMTRAVVFDATASELTDAALDWIIRYVNHALRRENKRLTRKRFSAGYGDFPLINQEWIYQSLSLDRLGVCLTGAYMLRPEKTVTAVLGIESISGAEYE